MDWSSKPGITSYNYLVDLKAQSTHADIVPEPARALQELQNAHLEIVLDCDDMTGFTGEFTPHLSVGQTRNQKAQALCAGWQANWQPLAFTLAHVYLIWRNNPNDDIFRIGPTLSLGGQ